MEDDPLSAFKLKCNELLEMVKIFSDEERKAGVQFWKNFVKSFNNAFHTQNNTDVNSQVHLEIESAGNYFDAVDTKESRDSVDVEMDEDSIEDEIELAKSKSDVAYDHAHEAGTPGTNEDGDDFGSLLSFLPVSPPMVKVDKKDYVMTNKDGFVHVRIEKTDGTVHSLKLAVKGVVSKKGNESEERVEGGKQLNLIRKQLDTLEKGGKPVNVSPSKAKQKKSGVPQENTRKRGRKPRPKDKLFGNLVTDDTGVAGYLCPECDAMLKTHSSLEVHMRVHTGEKPFTCDVCNKSFSTKGNMEKHQRVHDDVRLYQCEVCEGRFKDKKTLTTHMRTHTGEKPYGCGACGRSFSQLISLQTHMKIHNGEKSHLCDECGKSFRTKSQLLVHQRRHANIRNYKCTKCDFSSVCKGDLDRHMNRHSQLKPYLCTACPKTFTRSQYLREHMNVHLDKKPFSCKICQEAFSDQGSLYRHRRKHKDQDETAYTERRETETGAANMASLTAGQAAQGVVTEDVQPDLQNMRTIIVSAGGSGTLEVDPGSVEYLEAEGCPGETEVYSITCVNTDDLQAGSESVVVDVSAMDILANATTKQYTLH